MSGLELDSLENEFFVQVKEIKTALRDEYGINVPTQCNDFIRRCLRLKDLNMDKSLKLAKQFHTMMADFRNWDASFQPSTYKNLYLSNFCLVLQRKDSNDRQLFIIKPGLWNTKDMSFDSILASVWLLAQYATYEYIENQRNGIVTIWDFTNFNLQHAWAVKHRRLLSVMLWVQNSVACRIKGIHMIFHPKIISVIYSAIKPFLKEKLTKRIHFHGDSIESLHSYVSPHLLPSYLGGFNAEEKIQNKEFMDAFLLQDPFFSEWIKTGLPTK